MLLFQIWLLQQQAIMKKFRNLDIFKKVPHDLSQGTNLGGLISILTSLLIVYFTFSQIYLFINPQKISNIKLDQPFTRKELTINLDIEFPRFPCEIISLDLQDQMMSHHPNIGSVHKFRLDSEGKMIDSTAFELLNELDLFKQYQLSEQAFKNKYGCRLKGTFTVKQVPGNFHISSHAYQSHYMRLFIEDIIPTLDVSHIIHELYFGSIQNIDQVQRSHPQSQLTPLKGHKKIYNMSSAHSYISHYHIDIVPTKYKQKYFQLNTYQYTYNHNSFQIEHMPVVYFNYHIGGTTVVIANNQNTFINFLLNMCAVIGGIYALGQFLYNTLFAFFGIKSGYQQLRQ